MDPKALRGKPKRRKPTLATSKADGRRCRILRASDGGGERRAVGSWVAVTAGRSICIVVPRVVRLGCFLDLLGSFLDVTPLERRPSRLVDDVDGRGLEGRSVL